MFRIYPTSLAFEQIMSRYMHLGQELRRARINDPAHGALIDRLVVDLIEAEKAMDAFQRKGEQCGEPLLSHASMVITLALDTAFEEPNRGTQVGFRRDTQP